MILILDYPKNRNKYTNLGEEKTITFVVGGEARGKFGGRSGGGGVGLVVVA